MGAVEGNMGYLARQAKGEIGSGAERVAGGIQDAVDTAKAQPGGLQAGFLRVPGDVPGDNLDMGSYIKDAQGNIIPKPGGEPAAPEPNTATGQASTPLNANAEKMPPASENTGQSSNANDQTASANGQTTQPPRPTVKEQYPHYDANAPTGKPGSVHVYLNTDSAYGAEQGANAQAAVDNIPGATATDKYINIPARIAELGDQKNALAAADTSPIPSSVLRNNYMEELKPFTVPDGTVPGKDEMTQSQANKMVDNQMTKSYAKSGVRPNIDPATTQSTNSVTDIASMKDTANIDNQKLLARRGNGTPLSATDQQTLAWRDALQKTLQDEAPNVAKVTKEQSGLYDAAGSLEKQKEADYQAAAKAASQPKQSGLGKIGSLLRNPIVALPIEALGLREFGNGGADISGLAGKFVGAVSNSATGNNSTASLQKMKLNTTLPSHLDDQAVKKATGAPMTLDEYNQKILEPGYAPGSMARQNLDAQMSIAKEAAKQNISGDIVKFMGGDAQAALSAQAALENVNLKGMTGVIKNLSNAQAYSAYTSNPKNPYAQDILNIRNANLLYAQAVKDITGNPPDPKDTIQQGDTAEMIAEKLTAQNKFIQDNHNLHQPYWDVYNFTPTNSNSSTSPTRPQAAPAGFPPGFHFGLNPGAGGGLPPLGTTQNTGLPAMQASYATPNGLPPIQATQYPRGLPPISQLGQQVQFIQ